MFQPAALLPHPLLATHPNGTSPFAQQPFVFATTNNHGQAQPFFPGHPQPNFAFPFFLSPPLASTPTTPESPIFAYSNPTAAAPTTVTTTGGTAYSG